MFKKYLTLTLTVLVLNLAFGAVAFTQTAKDDKATKRAVKLKVEIAKLGMGKDAKIELQLSDGRKLRGYVNRIEENSFEIVNDKTGAATEVQYSDAKKVKGRNLSTGAAIAIGVGVGIGLLFLISYLAVRFLDD